MFLATNRTRFDGFWLPTDDFLGVKNSKNHFRGIWRHWPLMTRWFHDLISSLLSAKWMFESKSVPQITLECSRTKKVGKGHWPHLTSVDLSIPRQMRSTSIDLPRTEWPVESMSTTCDYMSTFIALATDLYIHLNLYIFVYIEVCALAKMAMLASFRLKCATKRIFRLTWPQLRRHRLNVRGSELSGLQVRSEFQGWRKIRMVGKL